MDEICINSMEKHEKTRSGSRVGIILKTSENPIDNGYPNFLGFSPEIWGSTLGERKNKG